MVDSCIFKVVWLWAGCVQECASSNWPSFPCSCVFLPCWSRVPTPVAACSLVGRAPISSGRGFPYAAWKDAISLHLTTEP
jgi:hypothetical protein